jgi:ubiquinone/menaquinone biosynthesis C-methylase UbiE
MDSSTKNQLVRIPEPAVMTPDEEAEYIKCNSLIFKGHPLIQMFSVLCPGFQGGRNLRVMDVGCGIANMAVQIAAAYPEVEVIGVDASVAMLRHGRALVEHCKGIGSLMLGDRVSLRCAWLPDADFGESDKSFDLIFARSALHHFVDPQDFWQVVKRYAKDDAAVFVLDLVRPTNLDKVEALERERYGTHMGSLRNAFHASLLASHTVEEIEQQLVVAGLDIAVAPYPEGTHVLAWRPGRFGKRAP